MRKDKIRRLFTFMLVATLVTVISGVSCKNEVGGFNNPVDPQNSSSVFSQSISFTQGEGTVPASTVDATRDISFSWEELTGVEKVQFQLGRGEKGSAETYGDNLIRESTNPSTPIGPVSLDPNETYAWRVRYGKNVEFQDGSPEFVWSSWKEVKLEFDLDMEVREFSMKGTLFGENIDLQSDSARAESSEQQDGWWFYVGEEKVKLMIRNKENIVEGSYNLGELSLGLSIYHAEIVRPNLGKNDYWPESGTITFEHYISNELIKGSYSLQGSNADLSGSFYIQHFTTRLNN